jgi:hypothetical protein
MALYPSDWPCKNVLECAVDHIFQMNSMTVTMKNGCDGLVTTSFVSAKGICEIIATLNCNVYCYVTD